MPKVAKFWRARSRKENTALWRVEADFRKKVRYLDPALQRCGPPTVGRAARGLQGVGRASAIVAGTASGHTIKSTHYVLQNHARLLLKHEYSPAKIGVLIQPKRSRGKNPPHRSAQDLRKRRWCFFLKSRMSNLMRT